MSSIRSLATITLLAGVGVFLYMKINETEPIIPAEVGDFDIGSLEFGQPTTTPSDVPQFGSAPADDSAPAFGTAPQLSATSPSDQAPTFNPNPAPASAAPTFSTEQAPAQNDSQVSSVPPPLATPPLTASSGTSNAIAGVPDLPPIPSVPESSVVSAEADSSTALPHVHAAETAQDISAPPAFGVPALESPPEFSPVADASQSPSSTLPVDAAAQAQSSLFAATRLAVEASLDRGELSQALLLLSDWYDDPSLSAAELQKVNELLRQLAGSVIYSTEHRLEPPYMVQAGERLEEIAQKYQVPWQLLAKINGITQTDQLQPGQQLKVIRGPFSALIDLGRRKMTLMLDRRYAGQFSLDVDPANTVEAGHWAVNQKLLTPGNAGFGASAGAATEERSLMLSNPEGTTNQLVILRGSNATTPTATEPAGRVIRISAQEIGDVYDILSLGSRVVVRR